MYTFSKLFWPQHLILWVVLVQAVFENIHNISITVTGMTSILPNSLFGFKYIIWVNRKCSDQATAYPAVEVYTSRPAHQTQLSNLGWPFLCSESPQSTQFLLFLTFSYNILLPKITDSFSARVSKTLNYWVQSWMSKNFLLFSYTFL